MGKAKRVVGPMPPSPIDAQGLKRAKKITFAPKEAQPTTMPLASSSLPPPRAPKRPRVELLASQVDQDRMHEMGNDQVAPLVDDKRVRRGSATHGRIPFDGQAYMSRHKTRSSSSLALKLLPSMQKVKVGSTIFPIHTPCTPLQACEVLLDGMAKGLGPLACMRNDNAQPHLKCVDVHTMDAFLHPSCELPSKVPTCMKVDLEKFKHVRNGQRPPCMHVDREQGYIKVYLGRDEHNVGVYEGAHRIVCWAFHGPTPPSSSQEGVCVCHSCHEPTCLSPMHVRWGNAKSNAHDRQKRRKGGQHPH